MNLLVSAIRTILTNASLNALVPIADITTSYSLEETNFPCIVIGISAGGSLPGVSSLRKITLHIQIFNRTSKYRGWEIYSLVKSLLHNNEQNISNSNIKLHYIGEISIDGDNYDNVVDAWKLDARYSIIFSDAGEIVTTISDGAIYAAEMNVTAIESKEIAKFSGELRLIISFESIMRAESERFPKNVWFGSGIAKVEIENVYFKPSSLNLLWSITSSLADTMADGITAATSYTITQASKPKYLQFLFNGKKTDDGKELEIKVWRAVCSSLGISFAKEDLALHNVIWDCYGDASSNILKVNIEN